MDTRCFTVFVILFNLPPIIFIKKMKIACVYTCSTTYFYIIFNYI